MIAIESVRFFQHKNPLRYHSEGRCINNYFELAKMSRPATLAFANLIFAVVHKRSEKVLMKKFRYPLLLLGLLTSPLLAKENLRHQSYDLMLMGGGLSICSSMQPQHCRTPLPADAGKSSNLFVVSSEAILRIEQSTLWSKHRQLQRAQLVQLLRQLQQSAKGELTGNDLLSALRAQSFTPMAAEQATTGAALVSELTDAEFDLLLDQLEVVQLSADSGQRLTERVYPALSQDPFSLELYDEFIQQAARRKKAAKPKVLLLAASGRDPFAAVDFYLDLFRQLGADASWLPLNAAYQASLAQANGCADFDRNLAGLQGSYQRSAVYPDLMAQQLTFCQQGEEAALSLIRQADGIFINGGNQSLTYLALKTPTGQDSAALRLIRQQIKAGQLIMAGSSAGTAVQAGGSYLQQATVMISNGQSETAFLQGAVAAPAPLPGCRFAQSCGPGLSERSLTYQAQGGLGLFPWGVLDTHFSERGREGRLLALVAQTGARFGFGIDEATALLARSDQAQQVHFRVLGREGVYVAERAADSHFQPGKLLKMQSHYFSREDEFSLSQAGLKAQPAAWKQPLLPAAGQFSQPDLKPASIQSDALTTDSYRQLASQLCQSQAAKLQQQIQTESGPWLLTLQRDAKTSSRAGQYQQNGQHKVYCSYQNMGVWLQTL